MINIDSCISNANDFFEVACNVDSKRFFGQYKYTSVFATNLSFACELYMKAILIHNKLNFKKDTKHSLFVLYQCIDNETKKIIEEEFNKINKLHSLDETLKLIQYTFVDFRYLYEDSKGNIKKLYYTQLGDFARALRNVCKEKFEFKIE